MSGYAGNPELNSEHALILVENAIHAARMMIPVGASREYCIDCGTRIPEARRMAQQGCTRCIECQPLHDRIPKIRMLDRIL